MLRPLNGKMAIALAALRLIGVPACKRTASERERRGSSSTTSSEVAKPVHPSVPGRNIPCPRGGIGQGGLSVRTADP